MWSYGKLGHTHEALIAALDQRTLQLLPQLQPQSVVCLQQPAPSSESCTIMLRVSLCSAVLHAHRAVPGCGMPAGPHLRSPRFWCLCIMCAQVAMLCMPCLLGLGLGARKITLTDPYPLIPLPKPCTEP